MCSPSRCLPAATRSSFSMVRKHTYSLGSQGTTMATRQITFSTTVCILLLFPQQWGRCGAARPRCSSEGCEWIVTGSATSPSSTGIRKPSSLTVSLSSPAATQPPVAEAGKKEEKGAAGPLSQRTSSMSGHRPLKQLEQTASLRHSAQVQWVVDPDETHNKRERNNRSLWEWSKQFVQSENVMTSDTSRHSLAEIEDEEESEEEEEEEEEEESVVGPSSSASVSTFDHPVRRHTTQMQHRPPQGHWLVHPGEQNAYDELEKQRLFRMPINQPVQAETRVVSKAVVPPVAMVATSHALLEPYAPEMVYQQARQQETPRTQGGDKDDQEETAVHRSPAGSVKGHTRHVSSVIDWSPFLMKSLPPELRSTLGLGSCNSVQKLLQVVSELAALTVKRGCFLASLLETTGGPKDLPAPRRQFQASLSKAHDLCDNMAKTIEMSNMEREEDRTVDFLNDTIRLLEVLLGTPMVVAPGECLTTMPFVREVIRAHTPESLCIALQQVSLSLLYVHRHTEKAIRACVWNDVPAAEESKAVDSRKNTFLTKVGWLKEKYDEGKKEGTKLRGLVRKVVRWRRMASSRGDFDGDGAGKSATVTGRARPSANECSDDT